MACASKDPQFSFSQNQSGDLSQYMTKEDFAQSKLNAFFEQAQEMPIETNTYEWPCIPGSISFRSFSACSFSHSIPFISETEFYSSNKSDVSYVSVYHWIWCSHLCPSAGHSFLPVAPSHVQLKDELTLNWGRDKEVHQTY